MFGVTTGNCRNANFLCARVAADVTAYYVDADETNNWFCIDFDIRKRCIPSKMYSIMLNSKERRISLFLAFFEMTDKMAMRLTGQHTQTLY